MATNEILYPALKGKMIEVYGSVAGFASAFGVSPKTVTNKLCGKTGWNLNEAQDAAELLHLSNEDICRIFFPERTCK